MKFFFSGSNIHQEALNIIRVGGDTVVLCENEDSYHLMDTLAEMARGGGVHSIDSWTIRAAARPAKAPFQDESERVLRVALSDFRVFLVRMRLLRGDHTGTYDGFGYFSDVVDHAMRLAGTRRVLPRALPDVFNRAVGSSFGVGCVDHAGDVGGVFLKWCDL